MDNLNDEIKYKIYIYKRLSLINKKVQNRIKK